MHGPGSARRRHATRGRRAALNTGKSSLKCHFWPICLSVSRRPISHTVPIWGEWLQFITISYMMILAGVYWKAIQERRLMTHIHLTRSLIPDRVTSQGSQSCTKKGGRKTQRPRRQTFRLNRWKSSSTLRPHQVWVSVTFGTDYRSGPWLWRCETAHHDQCRRCRFHSTWSNLQLKWK